MSSPIGVVTVSYGSRAVLGPFLESLPDSSLRPLVVVVADNLPNQDDGTVEMVHRAGGIYLPIESNPGYGAAMNAAVRLLPPDVEWVLISNPDVVLEEGSLDVLLQTASTDPAIGTVGPAITTDGVTYPSARAIPSLRTGVGHALFANLWVGNPWSRAYRNEATVAGSRSDVGWLSGACLLVRRSAFTQLGGFDPNYFMYFEDVDLGYRMGLSGYRNVYEPGGRARHDGAHSTGGDSVAMIRAHHSSARRFLDQKYGATILGPVRLALRVGLSIRSKTLERRARKDR